MVGGWILGRAAQAGRAINARRAELLTSAAFVGGWLLITWGLAALLTPIIWRLSLGLLLISLGGIRLLSVFAWEGLYTLTRDELVKRRRRR